MKNDQALRKHVLQLLKGDGAHAELEAAIKDIPAAVRGQRPKGAMHSPWEVIEHMRITQWDTLESLRNKKHVSPEFPAGYWPSGQAPANGKDWDKSAEALLAGLEALEQLVAHESTDLVAPIPGSDGQTVLRKMLMIADHNAYHLGQLILLRRLLGAWR